jgi:hypothetical protein
MDDYISKPIRVTELVDALMKAERKEDLIPGPAKHPEESGAEGGVRQRSPHVHD